MVASFAKFTLFLSTFVFCSSTFAFENPIWGASQLDSFNNSDSYYGDYHRNNLDRNQRDILDSFYEYSSRGHKTLGYLRARQILHGQVYLEGSKNGYFIRDVYCLKNFTDNDFGRNGGLGPEQIPDSNILNTEHTWPQSRFARHFPEEVQKSDLHHLFPSDSEMNSKRGNFKFAELSGKTIPVKCSASRLAKTAIGFRFEPPLEHRGNVARALFYFSVRYKISIDNDEEVYLRQWHQEDPVDQNERNHHEMIYQAQGNRNPFIDQPDAINQIVDL